MTKETATERRLLKWIATRGEAKAVGIAECKAVRKFAKEGRCVIVQDDADDQGVGTIKVKAAA